MLPSVNVDNTLTTVSLPSEEGDWTLWFSYKTLIAFQTDDRRIFKRLNTWRPEADQYLQSISDGPTLSDKDFEAAYQEHFRRHTVPA